MSNKGVILDDGTEVQTWEGMYEIVKKNLVLEN